MSGRVPQGFIDDVLNRTDIVELVSQRVNLKKAGNGEYKACCPFHSEKTPSFTVSGKKQFYHCFGCGEHGNALGFLMAFENMAFRDAVEILARQAGLELPADDDAEVAQHSQQKPILQLLKEIATFYKRQLTQHAHAQQYLKQRGLSAATIETYAIGYVPEGWRHVIEAFAQMPNSLHLLSEAGMTNRKEGSSQPYDRLRNRIIFPIHNTKGDVIGFGGRSLGDQTPKYLNSPETPVFHKSQELYGLYQALQAKRKLNRLIVVEGYMDVVGLAEHGIRNAVATLGTAVTSSHIQKMLKYCSKLAFCFDGDRAGRAAAWKALQVMIPLMRAGLYIRFVFLPDGQDPDSLVKSHGKLALKDLFARALSFEDFLFSHFAEGLNLQHIEGKASFVKQCLEALTPMPQGIFKQFMLEGLAKRVNMAPDDLNEFTDMAAYQRPAATKNADVDSDSSIVVGPRLTPVQYIISLLLQHPRVATEITMPDVFKKAKKKEYTLLYKLHVLLQDKTDINIGTLMEYWRGSRYERYLNKLATWQHIVPTDAITQEIKEGLHTLEQRYQQQYIAHLLERMQRNELNQKQRLELQKLIQQKNNSQNQQEELANTGDKQV